MSEKQAYPFKVLGQKLKTIRQKLQETVDEVSGAIEIDTKLLTRFEQGLERPGEDILMLLISHFGMQDNEAAALWQLAGYEPPSEQDLGSDILSRNMLLVMAVDSRVIYSDSVQIVTNNAGVVLNFAQVIDDKKQLMVARVGMSREQAHTVLSTLQKALQHPRQHLLPPTTEHPHL